MATALDRVIEAAPILEHTKDSVTKLVSSADAIMALPFPRNVKRARENLTDVPVRLILSAGQKMPERVVEIMKTSKTSSIGSGNATLVGLFISKPRFPVEVFLHKEWMDKKDPSGALTEDVLWHEFMHGIEGIVKTPDGELRREVPWSRKLEGEMNEADRNVGYVFGEGAIRSPEARALYAKDAGYRERLDYLCNGLDIQGNASELFAYAGMEMLRHMRERGIFPLTHDEMIDWIDERILPLRPGEGTRKKSTEAAINVIEILDMHSAPAQRLFWQKLPAMLANAARLYGCAAPAP